MFVELDSLHVSLAKERQERIIEGYKTVQNKK